MPYKPFNYAQAVSQGQQNAANAMQLREGVREVQGRNMLADIAKQGLRGRDAINYATQAGRPDVAQAYQAQEAEAEKQKYDWVKQNEWGVNSKDPQSAITFVDKAYQAGIFGDEERSQLMAMKPSELRTNLDRMMGREVKEDNLFGKINPSKYTPESIKKFSKSKDYGDLIAAEEDPTTVVNVGGDQDEFAKSLAKQFGKDFVERRKNTFDARNSLISANNAIDLLNSGVITGTGAEFITSLGKVVRRLGFDTFKDDVKNTEAYMANQASQVAQIIKAFGSGTGLSDADREYAEKAAAGKITMSEESLRRIIDINQKASHRVMTDFNADVGKIKNATPFDLSVDVPEMKKSLLALPQPQTEEEYNALPSGAEYIDPDDGLTYRKK